MKKITRLLLLALLLTSCSPSQKTDELQITASFYPPYFFTSKIVGDLASVTNVTPASVEPHDYELTPMALKTIEESDLLIVNGRVESWFSDLEKNLKDSSLHILNLTENMPLLENSDPHVWLSPILAQSMVSQIASTLKNLDPDHALNYEANAAVLTTQLGQLHDRYKEGLKNCQQKTFVTSHAAFAYLAKEYGLTQVPIAGLSPEAEPSAQQIAEIVDFVKANHVTTIFFESLVNPRLSETIASEVGANTMVLNPIEGITSQEAADSEDYFTEMDKNLDHLKLALQCQ